MSETSQVSVPISKFKNFKIVESTADYNKRNNVSHEKIKDSEKLKDRSSKYQAFFKTGRET